MQDQSPVLDTMFMVYQDILADKIDIIKAALTLQGKVRRTTGYDPLAGALTQLAIVSRKINLHEFDAKTFRAALDIANDRWWEWFDNRPRGLVVPPSAMNYSPRCDEREVIRERLRKMAYALPMPELEQVAAP